MDELYQDIAFPGSSGSPVGGTQVSVTAGATTSGVNFGLEVGGRITGTVTDAATGAGLAGVSVQFYRRSGATYSSLGSVTTDGAGGYALAELPTGTYFLYTSVSSSTVTSARSTTTWRAPAGAAPASSRAARASP